MSNCTLQGRSQFEYKNKNSSRYSISQKESERESESMRFCGKIQQIDFKISKEFTDKVLIKFWSISDTAVNVKIMIQLNWDRQNQFWPFIQSDTKIPIANICFCRCDLHSLNYFIAHDLVMLSASTTSQPQPFGPRTVLTGLLSRYLVVWYAMCALKYRSFGSLSSKANHITKRNNYCVLIFAFKPLVWKKDISCSRVKCS